MAHDPTVLYLHGGGYVAGSAFGYQPHAGALAAAAQTGVLVPDYRLAPEHPFPAAVEDALSAYGWMLEQGIAPERIAVAGDSAGGGLVLSLLLTLRRDARAAPRWRGDPLPVARPRAADAHRPRTRRWRPRRKRVAAPPPTSATTRSTIRSSIR